MTNAERRRAREWQRLAQREAFAEQARRSFRGLPRHPWIPRTRKRPMCDVFLLLEPVA